MLHINDKQWDELLDLLEDDFVGLIKDFVADSQERINIIKIAHEEGDNTNGLEASHALKGASASLGAEMLSHHCFVMQSICQAKMIDGAYNVVEDIENEFLLLSQEIDSRLTNLPDVLKS